MSVVSEICEFVQKGRAKNVKELVTQALEDSISAKEIPSLSRAATGNQMIKNGKVKSVSKV